MIKINIKKHRMNKYIQANKEKSVIKQSLDNKEISIEKYVSDIKTLNNNMPNIEKEMIKEYDDMSNALVTSDKNNLVLQKYTKELENKLLLTEKKAEDAKKYHNKIIKKDKFIHTLKESIKTDFLNFGENMIPKSYMRISKRFPHLTLQEIIDFEKKVRENGGSIQVHSGKFRLTERLINTFTGSYCPSHKEAHTVDITWDCCHSVAIGPANYGTYAVFPKDKPARTRVEFRKCKEYEESSCSKCKPITSMKCPFNPTSPYAHRAHSVDPSCCGAIDLRNSQPDGQCDFPVTFYLKEEDEKKQDISQVKVSDVTESILHNIKVLEKTIKEYSEKIEKLKSLQENLDLLKDI